MAATPNHIVPSEPHLSKTSYSTQAFNTRERKSVQTSFIDDFLSRYGDELLSNQKKKIKRPDRRVRIHISVMTQEPGSVKDENVTTAKQELSTTVKSKETGVDFRDDENDVGDYEVDDSLQDVFGVDVSNMSQTCKDCIQNKAQQKEYHLMPAHRCDRWDLESRTCWLDRNIGSTVTFSLTFKNSMEELARFKDVVWQQEFHLLHSKDRIFFVIKTEKPLWNTVISSRGHEFRLSPISEMDVEPNRFSATLSSSPAPLNKVHFKIRVIPIDLGFVYLGETLVMNMDSFISLPIESMAYVWYMEMDSETGNLPSNMRTSPSGNVLTISELGKEQEGVLSCSVFTNKGFFVARKRFNITSITSGGKRANPKNETKKPSTNQRYKSDPFKDYLPLPRYEKRKDYDKPKVVTEFIRSDPIVKENDRRYDYDQPRVVEAYKVNENKGLYSYDTPRVVEEYKVNKNDGQYSYDQPRVVEEYKVNDNKGQYSYDTPRVVEEYKVNKNDAEYSYDTPQVVENFYRVNKYNGQNDYDLPRYEPIIDKSVLDYDRNRIKRTDLLSKTKKEIERVPRSLKYRNGGRYSKVQSFKKGYGRNLLRPPVSMTKSQQQEIAGRILNKNSPEILQHSPFLPNNNVKYSHRTSKQKIPSLIAIAGSSRVDLTQNDRKLYQNEQQNNVQPSKPIKKYFKSRISDVFSNQLKAPEFPSDDKKFPDQYLNEVPPLSKRQRLKDSKQLSKIEDIDLSHPDDQISMLIAECHKNTQCSSHAICVVKHKYNRKSGFCRCLPNYRGNGISCWEFTLEVAPSFSD